jgi:hypothetical protein
MKSQTNCYMKPEFKYKLRSGSKKDKCPACGRMTFKPYVDRDGRIAGEQYGRCERINNCTYSQYPKDDAPIIRDYVEPIREPIIHSTIDKEVVESTFNWFGNNPFISYLRQKFGNEVAMTLQERYNIGTAKNNGTIFWQQSYDGEFRTAKVMYYGQNCKRLKDKTSWYLHKKINPDFVLRQVFFGEHLLKEHPDMPVALCESEKTAIIMSHLRPEYIWLASGGSEMLNAERFTHLCLRKLTVFPDEGQFEKWKSKTGFISGRIMNTEVESAFLAGNCAKGADILDLIPF